MACAVIFPESVSFAYQFISIAMKKNEFDGHSVLEGPKGTVGRPIVIERQLQDACTRAPCKCSGQVYRRNRYSQSALPSISAFSSSGASWRIVGIENNTAEPEHKDGWYQDIH